MAKDFLISRSIEITAPPERITPLLRDLRAWRQWSPWEGLDPHLERTYSGADAGVGAVYAWQGNSKAGAGRMEVLEDVDTPRRRRPALQRPDEGTQPGRLHPRPPRHDRTSVEWTMTGPQNVVMRVMSKVWSMEKMIGPDLEQGPASAQGRRRGGSLTVAPPAREARVTAWRTLSSSSTRSRPESQS